MSQEADRNFIKAAKDKIFAKYNPSPNTPEEWLIKKAVDVANAVHGQIKPILQSGGYKDKPALRSLITTLFLEAFDSKLFTREEIVNLCAIMSMENMMEGIEADPIAKGVPDKLSGV